MAAPSPRESLELLRARYDELVKESADLKRRAEASLASVTAALVEEQEMVGRVYESLRLFHEENLRLLRGIEGDLAALAEQSAARES
ncbi:hypothetical protein [Limnoglobus roseus]|uniref:Uncharacterized protein n=1 Tax=Limnoglobus roseus TaxID=2598579 RepID=A0A5C1APC0_9BACT|nr:hypothetical protein [Limnoglobus roseus]QEL20435.1 hypothetical protein PX52LOC_07533 [Limnoglobus roseus]